MPPKFKRDNAPLSQDVERQALLEGLSDDDDLLINTQNSSQTGSSYAQWGSTSKYGNDGKINRLQGQVTDVVGVMRENIGKVLERGDRLEELQDKSENLSSNADLFRSSARNLRKQMWWRECRMRILIAVIVLTILAVIFVPIIIHYSKG